MHISESKRCYNVIHLVHYFYVKMKMLADFQICISVPLGCFCIVLKVIHGKCDRMHQMERMVLYIFKILAISISNSFRRCWFLLWKSCKVVSQFKSSIFLQWLSIIFMHTLARHSINCSQKICY